METQPTQSPSLAGLTTGLTVWEAKERAGLLALETEKWREKRLLAEDPDTTADVLHQMGRDIAEVSKISIGKREEWKKGFLLCEAVAAHPNTPPGLLLELFNGQRYSRFLGVDRWDYRRHS